MKTFIVVLFFIAFLQSATLPLDLVLLILICRAYIKDDKANLYLAFGFGLLDSHLNLSPLGLNSLFYMTTVQLTRILSKTRLSGNPLLIIPLSLFLLSGYEIALSLSLGRSLILMPKVLIEGLISLPTLFIVRLWEERFIVRKDIKLKI